MAEHMDTRSGHTFLTRKFLVYTGRREGELSVDNDLLLIISLP
jgi:hypothetical protein